MVSEKDLTMNQPCPAPDRAFTRARRHRACSALAERGRIPDALLRQGIRRLCAQRLREEMAGGIDEQAARFARAHRHAAAAVPVAIHTDAANEQHYELPPAFFELCLGKRLKYSGCYYPRGDESLDQAEEAMLKLYGDPRRAGRRPADPRTGLRLGLADPVDGRALPECPDHRGLQLAPAA